MTFACIVEIKEEKCRARRIRTGMSNVCAWEEQIKMARTSSMKRYRYCLYYDKDWCNWTEGTLKDIGITSYEHWGTLTSNISFTLLWNCIKSNSLGMVAYPSILYSRNHLVDCSCCSCKHCLVQYFLIFVCHHYIIFM